MPQKKDKPKFLRPNYGRSSRKKIGLSWRRQRGVDNKKRINKAHMGASPSIGYGQDKKIKFFHPTGKKEVLIHNMSELEAVKDEVVRISASLSKRLKEKILAEAQKRKLHVVNPGNKKTGKPSVKKAANEKKIQTAATENAKKIAEQKPAKKVVGEKSV